jgi:hypothetical protein
MELFLNFLWVLIAVFGLSVWRVCWAPGRSGRREPLHEWTAIVAALVFLFFAVSLTDDLHSDLVLFEESVGGRRQNVTLACANSVPERVREMPGSASAGAVVGLAWFDRIRTIGYLSPFQQTSTSLLDSDLPFGRAPPSFSF